MCQLSIDSYCRILMCWHDKNPTCEHELPTPVIGLVLCVGSVFWLRLFALVHACWVLYSGYVLVLFGCIPGYELEYQNGFVLDFYKILMFWSSFIYLFNDFFFFVFVFNNAKLRWITETWWRKSQVGKMTNSKMQVNTSLTTSGFNLISPLIKRISVVFSRK